MSHFTVLIIGEDIESQLEPYDENKEVEPYEVECGCVGWKARSEARNKAVEKYKDIDTIRKEYHELPQEERTQEKWDEMVRPLTDLEKKFENGHPDKGKPDPECDECNGTGKHDSTYNPDSKWDWYSVGGRWTGYFRPKPKKDLKYPEEMALGESGVFNNQPRNKYVDQIRKCDIDLEKMRTDYIERGKEQWKQFQKELKESHDSPIEFIWGIRDRNITEEEWMKKYKESALIPSTYAVVKDGIWYEKGSMGWWGMSSNDKDEEGWKEEFNKLIESVPDDTLLTLVDCHI